jgi:hypothetical protein
VNDEEFFQAAISGAAPVGDFQVLQRTGHAPDHCATFPEGHYLKGIYLKAR